VTSSTHSVAPARRYASVPECAEILGISHDLVYELITREVLPAVKLGGRKVVPLRALELIEERALANFDPDAVLSGLAGAVGSRDEAALPALRTLRGPSGTAESEMATRLGEHPDPPAVAAQAASVVPFPT
jgi:excisionase family DNA binding protein